MPVLIALLLVAMILTLLIASFAIAWEVTHPQRITAAWAIARGLPTSPEDLGVTAQSFDVEIDGAAGRTVPVWVLSRDLSENERRPRPSLVIVHAYGQSRVSWLSLIASLLDDVDSAVLYDRTGHGESAHSIARLGTREGIDLACVIDRVLGDRPCVIVAFGDGASISRQAAVVSRRALNIRRQILIDPVDDPRLPLTRRLSLHGLPFFPLRQLAIGWLWLLGIELDQSRDNEAAPVDALITIVRTAPGSIPSPKTREVIIDAGSHHEQTDRLLEAIRVELRECGESK